MNSNWSYSPETVKLGVDLCDLDLWPLTLTFCMDVTFVIGNNSWKFHDDTMMGTWWKRCDGQTDGQTNWTSHIAAWSQLKNIGEKFFGISILFGPNLDNWQLVTTLLSTAGSLIISAFEKRSPGRQMRPINAPGDPEPHHRWSGWRLVNSPKFRCWHSSSIVFKLFIGCLNQNYYKIMYTHYLSSWIYKYK